MSTFSFLGAPVMNRAPEKFLPLVVELLRQIDSLKLGSRLFRGTEGRTVHRVRISRIPSTPRGLFTVQLTPEGVLEVEIYSGLTIETLRTTGVMESLALSMLILREDLHLKGRAFPAVFDRRNLMRCLREKLDLPLLPPDPVVFARDPTLKGSPSGSLHGATPCGRDSPHSVRLSSLHLTVWRYWENSCYFDSLLTPLFAGDCAVFRALIDSVDINSMQYSPRNICGEKSTLTSKDLLVVAEHFRDLLRADLAGLRKGQTVQCHGLRELARKCFPELRPGHGSSPSGTRGSPSADAPFGRSSSPSGTRGSPSAHWVVFEPGVLYGWMADLFPSLLMPYVAGITASAHDGNRFTSRRRALFDIWDFVGEDETRREEIVWSEYDGPVLVFQNGGSPPLSRFDQIGEEIAETPDYHGGRLKFVRTRFRTKRALGMTILDGRYVYVGGTLLQGARPGHEGGSHFISCLRVAPRHYALADDVSGAVTSIPRPEEWAFRDGSTKPILFFYVRVK